jgi:TPR repeat protein
MYIRGIGVAKNPVEGVRWFRMAAERDMPEAHTSLALAYEYGLGAPVDFDIAFGLRLKSHNRVHRNELIDSCAFLPEDQLNERDARDFRRNMHTRTPETFVHKAESYLTSGNPPDALCWYQRYADSAYTEGRYSLGKFYLANGGIPVDTKRGLHYLRVAAAQGSVPARVSLAQMFEAGYVVPKSLVAACALRFTTSRGLKDLDNVIDTCHLSIKDKMTADQIMLATQLIRDMLMPGQYISSLDRAISQ